jgi:histidinol phosphatase-like PHP family hydrolase
MIRQDFHIHTRLSSCSSDPQQTPANILKRAEELGLDQICLTDHFWDGSMPGASDWYKTQNLDHIRTSLVGFDLNKERRTKVFFGCETEYTGGSGIGTSHQTALEMDFVLIPISHFHMKGYVRPDHVTSAADVADLWVLRYEELLQLDLPWTRVGLAHVMDCCIGNLQEEFLRQILKKPVRDLFARTADKGIAVEINAASLFQGAAAQMNLEAYGLMKESGCKFTAGSDAHSLDRLGIINQAYVFAEKLGLKDDDFKVLQQRS